MSKSKSILSIVLLPCLVLAVAFLFAACGHEHQAVEEWSSDATSHWHACVDETCTEQLDKNEHTFGEWTTKTPATCVADEVEHRTCVVCDYEETRTGDQLATGQHTIVSTTDGHKCEVCGEPFSHEASADAIWQKDADSHWKECKYDGCTAKVSEEEHDFGIWTNEGTVVNGQQKQVRTCEVCDYEDEQFIDVQDLVVVNTLKADAEAIVNAMVASVYNNVEDLGKETDYTVAQIQEKIEGFEYYVEVGTIYNIDTVNTISFNGFEFASDQIYYLSIGNDNFIKDKVFYVQDGKLYVAAPIVTFEAVEHTTIKVNDNEFAFDLAIETQPIEITDVKFNGSNNTVEETGDNAYTLNIKSGTEFVGLFYEEAEANDVVIIKHALNDGSVSYSLTTLDNTAYGYCLGFYPVGWVVDMADVNYEKYQGSTWDYTLYIVNKGVTANMDLTINILPSFDLSTSVVTDTDTIIDNIIAEVYNNSTVLGTKTTYSVAEIQEKIKGFEYYVEVGSVINFGEINTISFNGISLTKDQTFYLSIGNSNQLLDKAFYVQDGKLYVAAPIVKFEAVEHSTLKINDNVFDFAISEPATEIEFTNVRFNDGCVSTADKVSNTEYTLNIKSGKEYAGLYYEGAQKDDVIITKRLLNGELNGYGIVQPYNGTDGYCSYLYAVGWVEDFSQVNIEKFDGAVYDYSVYIASQDKIANVTLNINVVTETETTPTE